MFCVRVTLNVPGGGATITGAGAGVTVVVDSDDVVVWATAMPVVSTSAIAPARSNLLTVFTPKCEASGRAPGVTNARWGAIGPSRRFGIYSCSRA